MLWVGSEYRGDGLCHFRVWAPGRRTVEVRLISPVEAVVPMREGRDGFWEVATEGLFPGTLYTFRLDGSLERPDPASHLQPQGVHGPSEIVDHAAFAWTDASWRGIDLDQMIIYEIHTGTFTPEGTFDAVIPRLADLRELGINALELMPVAQFPGDRNWGYDGVYPYAVQHSYGGPFALKRLVDACHREGIAVILDVVYNHLGPEGNYLHDFGPYFSDKYRTPWGPAINLDDAYCDVVRDYLVQNAVFWLTHYHLDGLRLDAIHAMVDMSAQPFLQELTARTATHAEKLGKPFHLIAESDLNDVRAISPATENGFGLHAQWCDDFHHCLHTLLTGEATGYYADFGRLDQLERSLREGFVYSGEYSAYRRRRHGNASRARPVQQFVVFLQNHDQVGNRPFGERLATMTDLEGLKLAAAAVLLSPYIPLLFMGEEYGELTPFLYFVSHTDPDIIQAVRLGRRKEFEGLPDIEDLPDPQDPKTFARSRIVFERSGEGHHRVLRDYYRELIHLRTAWPPLAHRSREHLELCPIEDPGILAVRRRTPVGEDEALCLFNFLDADHTVSRSQLPPGVDWTFRMSSSDRRWGGPDDEPPARGAPVLLKRRSVQVHLKKGKST